MGDILHALPAVTALRRALPGAHIGWAVEPHWSPLLAPQLVDHIHPVPTRAWKQRPFTLQTIRELRSLRRDLRAAHYDIAVDLQGSIRSALIARLSAAPRILGPAAPREALAAHLYRERISTPAISVIQQAAQLLSAAFAMPLTPQTAILPTDPVAEAWADSLALPPASPSSSPALAGQPSSGLTFPPSPVPSPPPANPPSPTPPPTPSPSSPP